MDQIWNIESIWEGQNEWLAIKGLKTEHVCHLKCFLICFKILNEWIVQSSWRGGADTKLNKLKLAKRKVSTNYFPHHTILLTPSCIPNESALILGKLFKKKTKKKQPILRFWYFPVHLDSRCVLALKTAAWERFQDSHWVNWIVVNGALGL